MQYVYVYACGFFKSIGPFSIACNVGDQSHYNSRYYDQNP